MDNRVKPTAELERIPSLDFLRGVAILGILFINIESFAYSNPWSSWQFGFEDKIDYHVRFWIYFLTQGKFYSMFVLLFGVGFVIFLDRLEHKNIGLKAMDIYTRRMLWLFIFGVIHAYFIWDGDILYHYSICGLLLLPFRSIKSNHLALVIFVLASFLLVKQYETTAKRQGTEKEYLQALDIDGPQRNEDQIKRITTWEKRYSKKLPDSSEVKNPRPSYWDGLKKSYEHVTVHKGAFYYKSLLFPSLIVMLLGMMLYRAGIFVDYTVWKNYWLISVSVLIIGLTINYFRFYHWTYEDHKPITNIWQSFLYTFPKESLGLGYILMLNGIYQKFFKGSKIGIISKIGRTALSNYIFQSLILGLIFYGYGFGMFNSFSRFELLSIVVCIWFIQISITWIWLKYHAQGPLEWLWRKLTYGSFTEKNDR